MQKLDELMREKGKSVKALELFLKEYDHKMNYNKAWNRINGRTELNSYEKKVIAKWLGVSEKELEA